MEHFKKIVKDYQAPSFNFKKKKGELIHNNNGNCKRLAEYFEELLNCEPPREKMTFSIPGHKNTPSIPPDKEELKVLISELKNNKAAGEDQIIVEFIKLAGDKTANSIVEIFKEFWKTEKIFAAWKTAIIHPIFKKGDRTKFDYYRGILVPYKILSAALMNRIKPYVEDYLGDTRKVLGRTDHA